MASPFGRLLGVPLVAPLKGRLESPLPSRGDDGPPPTEGLFFWLFDENGVYQEGGDDTWNETGDEVWAE